LRIEFVKLYIICQAFYWWKNGIALSRIST